MLLKLIDYKYFRKELFMIIHLIFSGIFYWFAYIPLFNDSLWVFFEIVDNYNINDKY